MCYEHLNKKYRENQTTGNVDKFSLTTFLPAPVTILPLTKVTVNSITQSNNTQRAHCFDFTATIITRTQRLVWIVRGSKNIKPQVKFKEF